MAGDSSAKMARLEFPAFPELSDMTKLRLTEALNDLETDVSNSLWLLKITKCDADHCSSLSKARCYVERSSEDVANPHSHIVYDFAGIFDRGVTVLKSFLNNPSDLPKLKGEKVGLQRLVSFLKNIDDVGKKLAANNHKDNMKRELHWTLQVVHHVLKELAVNQRYIVDDQSKLQIDFCPCCREDMTGSYGDTSIGHTRYWHGSVDILMEHESLALKRNADLEIESSLEGSTSSLDYLKQDRHQIISEAIVFASLQKQRNTELENFLIPTIGISKKNVIFYFYDAEHDILLESASFDLFVPEAIVPELPYQTVLALWLTMNYKYFCSGITRAMKDRDFTADFLSQLPDDVHTIYKDKLRLGNCRSEPVEELYRPRGGSRWSLRQSAPFKTMEKC